MLPSKHNKNALDSIVMHTASKAAVHLTAVDRNSISTTCTLAKKNDTVSLSL